MTLNVEIEFIEVPDESEQIKKFAGILAKGVYAYLKEQGLLRVTHQQKEKVQQAINKAQEIISRDIPD
ncbi:MAG: hypothetical protein HQL13_05655 [Candidatus Omnitrophica bacterium]|nr:hypothetical protein [Candidatus Omnitrophota bacterium]